MSDVQAQVPSKDDATAKTLAALLAMATPEQRATALYLSRKKRTRAPRVRRGVRTMAKRGDRVTVHFVDGSQRTLNVWRVGTTALRLTTQDVDKLQAASAARGENLAAARAVMMQKAANGGVKK